MVSPPITFPLHPQDHKAERPRTGSAAPSPAAAVASIAATPLPEAHLATPPAEAESPAAGADPGGRVDDLSQVAATYRRAIMARLEAQRSYPRDALLRGRQGTGAVLFRIERSGRLLDLALTDGTGQPALDSGALGIVRDAAPFPAIPEGLPDELAITVPVEFLIDRATDPAPTP